MRGGVAESRRWTDGAAAAQYFSQRGKVTKRERQRDGTDGELFILIIK